MQTVLEWPGRLSGSYPGLFGPIDHHGIGILDAGKRRLQDAEMVVQLHLFDVRRPDVLAFVGVAGLIIDCSVNFKTYFTDGAVAKSLK